MEANVEVPLLEKGVAAPCARGEGVEEDPKAEAVYRKISFRILPALFLVLTVCYLDRTNISLAAVSMSDDIGVSKKEYGTAASLFFVTYMVFQIPSNEILKKVGAPLWLGVILMAWGVTASLTGFVKNTNQLYVMRLLLGVFEAGTFPGVFYYLSLFYPDRRLPFAISIVWAGLLMGLCLSAPIAGGLLSLDGVLSLKGWQWLFMIEGIPSFTLGSFIIFYLPKFPCSGNFLSPEEQAILRADNCVTSKEKTNFSFLIKNIVLNLRLWVYLVAWNIQGIARYAAQFWTPIWIHAMASGEGLNLSKGDSGSEGGNDDGVLAAFLTTLPYVFAAGTSVIVGRSSTRFRERKYHIALVSIFGSIAFFILPQVTNLGIASGIIALIIVNSAVGGVSGPQMALALSCMSNESKAFGLAWFNSVGNLCGIIGPLAVGLVVEWTGSYVASLYLSGIVLLVAGGMYILVKDNIH